jgi:hypothetical protein
LGYLPQEDYGGQFEVLEFKENSGLEGKVSLGLVYENDQKEKVWYGFLSFPVPPLFENACEGILSLVL